ncbi:MAG TPA: MFS transporter [Kineosporiaceae bacterium]
MSPDSTGAPPPAGPGREAVTRVVLAALAVLLTAADTYVVVLALPEMMAGVGLGLDQLQRGAPIVTVFLLGYVVVLALAGRVSDVLGRQPVLVACLATFAAGSLITAGSHHLGAALVGRGLQGLGAGGLVPPTLALVADLWPADRRSVPLGLVGAAQELGSVLGPLFGAAVLAFTGWRTIFWANLGFAVALCAGLTLGTSATAGTGGDRPARRGRRRGLALAAALATVLVALLLNPPDALVDDVTLGTAFVPLAGDTTWTSPLALATMALVAALAAPVVRRRPARLAEADLPGAALVATALAGLVLTFADADPTRSAIAAGWPWMLGLSAAATAALVVRQRLARHPLVPPGAFRRPGAWGALLVNLLIGVGLVAALVDVPVFARQTRYPSSQLGAALVLVQLLVALPVGAAAGGWASRRARPALVAAAGCLTAAAGLALMSRWGEHALDGAGSSTALVLAGLGFGLAVAPVNTVLLAATGSEVHGLAGALGVLARMVGMLVGLSLLTAVGLRVFYARQTGIGTPLTLCPTTPFDCPAYVAATRASALDELRAIFAGGAGCTLVAGVLCLLLLTARSAARPDPALSRA